MKKIKDYLKSNIVYVHVVLAVAWITYLIFNKDVVLVRELKPDFSIRNIVIFAIVLFVVYKIEDKLEGKNVAEK